MTYIKDITPASPSGDDLLLNGDDQIRALKADIKNTLGGLGGAVREDADTSGVGGTTLVTHTTMSSWEARIKALEAGGGAGAPATGSIPVGGIMVWYGNVGTIPAGWKQCNGASYTYSLVGGGSATIQTPDLRGRVITGPGATNAPAWNYGSTPNWLLLAGTIPYVDSTTVSAGAHTHQVASANHTLTSDQLPLHSHYMFTDSIGTVDTDFLSSVASTRGDPGDYDMAKGSGTINKGISGTQTHTPLAHNHGTSTSTSSGAHTHTVGVNMPYLGLYHIMYVADGVSA
jgi:microcystin-dependent protein